MSELIFKKAVDLSLLKYGTTVPKECHGQFINLLGFSLQKGQSHPIQVIINKTKYEAHHILFC